MCEHPLSGIGLGIRRRVLPFAGESTTLVVPGHEKLRIPPTARYFSGITDAGVRSNIIDNTLLLPPYLAISDLTCISLWRRARAGEPSAAPSPPATALDASGRGHGTVASGLSAVGCRDAGELGH